MNVHCSHSSLRKSGCAPTLLLMLTSDRHTLSPQLRHDCPHIPQRDLNTRSLRVLPFIFSLSRCHRSVNILKASSLILAQFVLSLYSLLLIFPALLVVLLPPAYHVFLPHLCSPPILALPLSSSLSLSLRLLHMLRSLSSPPSLYLCDSVFPFVFLSISDSLALYFNLGLLFHFLFLSVSRCLSQSFISCFTFLCLFLCLRLCLCIL